MLLEFEKPIAELEQKLALVKEGLVDKPSEEIVEAITTLEEKIRLLQADTLRHLTRWQKVQLARHADRPYTLDYVEHMLEDFIALGGDRCAGEDHAVVGGLGRLDGRTIMLIGHQKGRNTRERQKRNFAMANPEGYRKALRLMRLAEKFNKPILTLIDTPGAYPGIESEQRGQAHAIASNIQAMFGLRVPVVCVVIGEGASGGALGIGVGDRVLMLEHTWYSVISPESCSSILWKNWHHKEQAAEMLKLTAQDMKSQGLIDEIVPEPLGGAHKDYKEAARLLKARVHAHVTKLESLSPSERIQQRVDKFCAMGATSSPSREATLEDLQPPSKSVL